MGYKLYPMWGVSGYCHLSPGEDNVSGCYRHFISILHYIKAGIMLGYA